MTATRVNPVYAAVSHTHDYTKTRVKGNAESSYRTGDVNLTPANIGAAAANHTHSSAFTTRELTTSSQNIAATAGGKEGSMDLPTVSGYTCVGVVGAECSAWELPISKSISTSAKWYWAVSNPRRAAYTFTVHAKLLYIKDAI